MWRRDLGFAFILLAVAVLVVTYVLPRRKFAEEEYSLVAADSPLRDEIFSPENDISDCVAKLNGKFEQAWQSENLCPAPKVNPLTVARRISLGLTGTVPSIEEIKQLEQLNPDAVGDHWLAYLFADRRFGDHVAERMARALVGTEEGPFLIFRRRRFVSWLSDQFMNNRPFDELVREIVTSSGLWTDSPAVNFLTVTTNPEIEDRPDPIRLAGRTTRAFLGLRLDCMQCHDDNLDGVWLQSDFHELAAFYREPTTTIVGLVDKDREYEWTYLDEDKSQSVLPQVPFSDELLPRDGPLRARLATWITHPQNRPFARVIVNRAWALLFGKPLVTPIDDIPLDGPFPPGMELLADDLVEHEFDLHRLLRIIVASRAFQSDSKADHELTEMHEQHWASFPVTRLRPEQIAGALLQSARLTTVDRGSHVLFRLARFNETNDFVNEYGDSGENEFSQQGGTIPQRLVLMNGNLVRDRTKGQLLFNAATRIARLSADNKTAIEAAFLAVLTRYPRPDETEYFQRQWGERAWAAPERIEDLCWSLLNSSEFSWNH